MFGDVDLMKCELAFIERPIEAGGQSEGAQPNWRRLMQSESRPRMTIRDQKSRAEGGHLEARRRHPS
jgi:hypothetical protein